MRTAANQNQLKLSHRSRVLILYSRRDFDFQIFILLAPRQACQPVFAVHSVLRLLPLFGWNNPRLANEFRTGDFASHRAGSHSYAGVIADALRLSGIDSGLHVKFVVPLGEPDRRIHRDSAFSERLKANVFLPSNLAGYGHGVRSLYWLLIVGLKLDLHKSQV